MSTATITIGPEYDGRPMSLDDFSEAEAREGYVYELSRGVVIVNQVPNEPHFDLIDAIQDQLRDYKKSHPEEVYRLLEGGSAKVESEYFESERHPDLLIYKSRRPKDVTGRALWKAWTPELVIEIVSPESADREYNLKPDEYRQVGIQEYWIIDERNRLMTVHQRSSDAWTTRTVSPSENYETELLPGFEFDVQRVFDAADV